MHHTPPEQPIPALGARRGMVPGIGSGTRIITSHDHERFLRTLLAC
jgi:hypothetical protein